MSWVSSPRRRWVGSTDTQVTPAVGTVLPGNRHLERVDPAVATSSSPSNAASVRSNSSNRAFVLGHLVVRRVAERVLHDAAECVEFVGLDRSDRRLQGSWHCAYQGEAGRASALTS